MKRIVLLMTLVWAFAVVPAALHAQAMPPMECLGLPANDWVDIQDDEMALLGGATEITDSAASDGYAVEVPANAGWTADYTIPASQVGTWHVYASIRCSSIDTSGLACDLGIFDGTTTSYQIIYLENGAVDGNYHQYDMGIQQLTTNDVIYVAAPTTTDTTVYVDRYFLMAPAAPGAVATVPSMLTGIPSSDWVDILPKDFSIFGGPTTEPSLISDPAAAGGYTVEVPAQSDWTPQYPIPASQTGDYHCYASIKCSSIDTAGRCCDVGVVDSWGMQYTTLYIEDGAANGQYQIYDLGEHQIDTAGYFFVSDPYTYDTTVYVDRFFMVARPAATPPAECVGIPSNDWIDIQDSEMGWGGATDVPDPAASDLWALAIPPENDWVAVWTVPASLVGTTWHCYASIRCQSIDTAGFAANVQIYDSSNGGSFSYQTIYLQNGANDGQYHQYRHGDSHTT